MTNHARKKLERLENIFLRVQKWAFRVDSPIDNHYSAPRSGIYPNSDAIKSSFIADIESSSLFEQPPANGFHLEVESESTILLNGAGPDYARGSAQLARPEAFSRIVYVTSAMAEVGARIQCARGSEALSSKEGAKDIPSWAQGKRPKVGESGDEFAKRLLDDQYGEGNWKKGSASEQSKLKKYAERNFE